VRGTAVRVRSTWAHFCHTPRPHGKGTLSTSSTFGNAAVDSVPAWESFCHNRAAGSIVEIPQNVEGVLAWVMRSLDCMEFPFA
jgi:hypothetical protein